jgi:hypothetical protein
MPIFNPGTLTGEETFFEGPAGWAKRVEIPDSNRNKKYSISSWLLFAPRAHPMWAFHTFDIIRLAVLDENDPLPQLNFPEATHEYLVLSLNPEYQPYTAESLAKLRSAHIVPYLTPPDAHGQFEATDEAMQLLACYAARSVASGHLVPDSDYRESWQVLLGRTLEHMQTGCPDDSG